MKLLVTGGEGFIGQYVQSRAKELGFNVWTYDIINEEDVLDRESLIGAAETYDVDAIIHLAGMLGTHELWDTAEKAIDVNIKGALNVAAAAMATDAKLVSIEQPHIWYNVYEATKFAARRMLTGLHYDQGLKVEFVTAHNAFGPGQAYGDGHPQKIIPTFATKAWLGEPIPIWGNGQQKVNLIYAGDVADMLLKRAAYAECQPLDILNAGSNVLMTVADVAAIVLAHTDSSAGVKKMPMRKGEQSQFPYPEATNEYGYTVSRSALNATIDWYKPK